MRSDSTSWEHHIVKTRRRGVDAKGEPFAEVEHTELDQNGALVHATSIVDEAPPSGMTGADMREFDTLMSQHQVREMREREADSKRREPTARFAGDASSAAAGDWLGQLAAAEDPAFSELRGRCRLSRWLRAARGAEVLGGAEAELALELGGGPRKIPFAMFEPPASRWAAQDRERRADSSTSVPATVGVNMSPVVAGAVRPPASPSVSASPWPTVASGTHSVSRVSTNLTAGARVKGAVVRLHHGGPHRCHIEAAPRHRPADDDHRGHR